MTDSCGVISAINGFTKTFINAIMAGIFIGIAGTVFLSVAVPALGAFLFAFGLLTILCYQFKLFTGAIGYLANQGKNFPGYIITLFAIWSGNFAGCFAVGTLVRTSRIASGIVPRVQEMCAVKQGDSFVSLLILSFFCGILMYVAVETFRKEEINPFARTLMVFLCVVIFILSGFEHSIAGMYYFSAAGMWSWQALDVIGIMTLGNALGGMLLPVADKIR